MNLFRQRDSRSGFTLLEILVVVLIITILATIVGVNVANQPGKARVAAAKAQIVNFKTAIDLYRMEQSRAPTQEQGLLALCQKPTTGPVSDKYPDDGYLGRRTLPKDPWDRDYIYLSPGSRGESYEIVTYGADGVSGGTGEDADISSSDL